MSVDRAPISRREQVVSLLRDAIVTGEIGPGERLKQDELCDRFGLSATPVREALRDLESEGLVRHSPNRGVVVAEITPEELLGVLVPVRFAIESFALPLAASQMPPATLEKLETIVRVMGQAAEAGNVSLLNDLDVRFHETAVEASGSEQALQLWRSVLPRIQLQFERLAPRHEELMEIEEEHRDLLSALRTRSAPAIVTALHEHIVESAGRLLARATG